MTSKRLVLLALLFSACNSPAATSDAGSSGTDTGTPGTDAGTSAEVAACQAIADELVTACQADGGDRQRECAYGVYRSLCADGRTSVMTALLTCLRMDACQTFSDPSAARDCVVGVIAANTGAAQQTLGSQICTCDPTTSGCPGMPSMAEVIGMSDADAMTMTTCLQASCADANACIAMTTHGSELFACYAPPSP